MTATATREALRPPPLVDENEVRRTLRILLPPEQVTEVRCLHATLGSDRWATTLTGYFNDHEKLLAALSTLSSAAGVYLVPNPVDPQLLGRAANRLKRAAKGESTNDGDIVRRRWLLLDTDTNRPKGICATAAQREAALSRMKEVIDYLREQGWPQPLFCDSGNGGHGMLLVDLPCDDGGLVERCIKALSARFTDNAVKLDPSVFNLSRIWRLYGTRNGKGDHLTERPWRMSRIISAPEELVIVDKELLIELAAEALEDDPPKPVQSRSTSSGPRYDIESFIARNGFEVDGPKQYKGGRKWKFRKSPLCEHEDEAFLIEGADGRLGAGCPHKHCAWHWKDLRAKFDPKQTRQESRRQSTQDLPKAPDVESALLGCVLLKPEAFGEVLKLVRPSDFADAAHIAIFSAMAGLHVDGFVIEPLAIREQLQNKPHLSAEQIDAAMESAKSLATKLTNSAVSEAHARHYGEQLAEVGRKRRIAQLATQLGHDANNGKASEQILTDLGAELYELNRSRSRKLYTVLADVEPEDPRWIWHNHIPRASITEFCGDADVGKSTLLCDIISRVTTGRPMPPAKGPDGMYDPETVIYLSAEDSRRMTIRPRVDAAGGDPCRVILPDEVYVLPGDVAILEEIILDTGTTILVIDPPEAFIDAELDSHNNASIRRALSPLAQLAERTDLGIIHIRHPNKQVRQKAAYRSSGSIAWFAACRSAFMVAPDLDDEWTRIMVPTKSNLCVRPVPLAYYIEAGGKVGRVVWLGERPGTSADKLMGCTRREDPEVKKRRAMEKVVEVLSRIYPEAMSQRQLRKQEGLTGHGVLKPALDALAEDDQIEQTQNGWRLKCVNEG